MPTPIEMGRIAFSKGLTLRHNPFNEGTDDFMMWRQGFMEASGAQ